MDSEDPSALFRKVDCIRLPVPDLDAALAFYRDELGHRLNWRNASGAGLALPESESELVIHTEGHPPEIDMLVDSAPEAAERFVAAGGRLIAGPSKRRWDWQRWWPTRGGINLCCWTSLRVKC